MVCHIDRENPGHLVVLIPVCLKCKRALKRDTFRGISNDADSVTMTAPIVVREVLFRCPKNHVLFRVGAIDLQEIAKYPQDRVRFESAPNLDPKSYPTMPYHE
jgi:hypothetical protein